MRLFLMWPAEPTFLFRKPFPPCYKNIMLFYSRSSTVFHLALKPLPAGPCPSRRLAHCSSSQQWLSRTILSSTHCVSEALFCPTLPLIWPVLGVFTWHCLGPMLSWGEELNYFSPMVLEVCLASVNFRRICLDSDLQIHIPYSLCSPGVRFVYCTSGC